MAGTLPAGVSTDRIDGDRPVEHDRRGRRASRAFANSDVAAGRSARRVSRGRAQQHVRSTRSTRAGWPASEFDIDDNGRRAELDRQMLNESIDSLRIIAEQTDGRAIVNRNDPVPELQQMLRDTSAYYLLGYTSTLAAARRQVPRDPGARQAQGRRGARAQGLLGVHRRGRRARRRRRPSRPPARDVAGRARRSRDRRRRRPSAPVRVWLGAARGDAGKADRHVRRGRRRRDTVSDPADAIDHVTRASRHRSTGDEAVRGPGRRAIRRRRAPPARVTFDAPPGRVRLHIVGGERARACASTPTTATSRCRTSRRAGAADHRRRSSSAARTARDIQQLRAAPAPLPTATRAFSRTERLLVRFQAYGPAGTTPTVTMRLLNQHGRQRWPRCRRPPRTAGRQLRSRARPRRRCRRATT